MQLEISLADDVRDRYPNFQINYEDEEEFIQSLISNIETPFEYLDFDTPINHFDRYGYRIEVKPLNS